MFTGLIEDVGTLRRRQVSGDAGKLVTETSLPLGEIQVGDSIAVNGACLTVEKVDSGRSTLTFHTLAETFSRTNLGTVAVDGPINLERAMRLGDRLGGHLVSGHIDAKAEILKIGKEGADYVVRIALPEELAPLTIPKGSIAVNGISLTIAELADDSFSVHIIPHTWNHTNLGALKPGSQVNLEADMIGKFILRQEETGGFAKRHIKMDDLRSAGF